MYEKPRITFTTTNGNTRYLGGVTRDPERKDMITVYQYLEKKTTMFEFSCDVDKEIIIDYIIGMVTSLTNEYKSIQVHCNYYNADKPYDFDKYTLDGLNEHIRLLMKFMSYYHTLYICDN